MRKVVGELAEPFVLTVRTFLGVRIRPGGRWSRPPRMGVGKTPLKRSLSWATKRQSDVKKQEQKEGEEEKARQAQSRLVREPGVWGSPAFGVLGLSISVALRCAHSSVALCVPHLGSCLLSGFSLWPAWSLVLSLNAASLSCGVSATYKLGLSWAHIPSGFQSCLVVRCCNLTHFPHSLNPVCMFIMWQDKGKASPLLRTERSIKWVIMRNRTPGR